MISDDDSSWNKDFTYSSSSKSSPSTEEGSLDALLRDFGDLGTTPPRTRILRRNHHRKQKDKRSIRRACKFAQFCQKSIMKYSSPVSKLTDTLDGETEVPTPEPRKKYKRNIHRHRERESERDFKLDFGGYGYKTSTMTAEHSERLPTIKVESSNRFLSLSCKLVKAAGQWRRSVTGSECPRERVKFHETISVLVKTGTCDNKEKGCFRQLSKEETMWQTELKDLIWLELQAWHALRTPSEQDQYLCEARHSVPQLLLDILNYKFINKADQLSVQSRDSGVHFTPELEDIEKNFIQNEECGNEECTGCLWLFCPPCMERENAALHQVEMLLCRLEFAEGLYPSSRAFALQNPVYMSNEFKGRVKAMCSWYNITRQHRLKLIILGRQLLSYAEGNNEVLNSSSSSDSLDISYNTGLSTGPDLYNIKPITTMGKYLSQLDNDSSRNYRKFIEDVLKGKGLRKALYFLEKINLTVLRKARIALEKPSREVDKFEDEEGECRKYGCWSSEAKSLNLPSIIPAFLFISRIPIDLIHEFLRMRLETKPENPSVLSIRQLIRELKEGLRLAVLNRERYLHHVNIALTNETEDVQEKFKNSILQFDESLTSVLELYLNYLYQWVMMTQKERIQKNLLEEEWKFIISTSPHIPQGDALAGRAFCKIASKLMESIQDDFLQQVIQMTKDITDPDPDSSIRQSVLLVTRNLQTLSQDIRDRTHRILILCRMLNKHLGQDIFYACDVVCQSVGGLKVKALQVCATLNEVMDLVESTAQHACEVEDADKATITSRFREVLHLLYKFGFEYYREVFRLINEEGKRVLFEDSVKFCRRWLNFVTLYCEKGRGIKPRWAHNGLEFLLWVVTPENSEILSSEEFECLKLDVEQGIGHIMGTASPTSVVSSAPSYLSTRTRSSSPRPLHHRNSVSTPPPSDLLFLNGDSPFKPSTVPPEGKKVRTRQGNILKAITRLDNELDAKRRNEEVIGSIIATPTPLCERNLIKLRPVNFTWQRGIKIGQGRFGKVYTAVNNDTGELMAMKEIPMLPNDVNVVRSVALELKIIEGIQHQNLIRYYGTEIHREELLIFMELCPEGTLESLVESTESGLPEALVRRYTSQLVSAIGALHQHSIVHRDIKTANIFLTNEGNCLKIGDFGSAIKIKAHTTVPGELKGFVGTQAYMAPEVFMNTNKEGHGRAADIWSLGCVIIEMASGRRPWHEFDSNYQIMFKVGMGETPNIPDNLSEEGRDFVSLCLQHNPKLRPTTSHLSQHNFIKVDTEEESVSFITSSVLEEYLKLGVKR